MKLNICAKHRYTDIHTFKKNSPKHLTVKSYSGHKKISKTEVDNFHDPNSLFLYILIKVKIEII